MGPNSQRRQFLKLGAGVAGVLTLSSPLSKAFAQSCGLTPKQTAGPFYPGESEFTSDNDLTQIPGNNKRAEGQVVYVRGKVVDQNCRPVKGANVEIWQACASGKYNNPKDPNPAPIDPNFRYWAEAFTNENGEYIFKTIIPGAYPAAEDWVRPPHIHFRISAMGYRELITQMYFKGYKLNDKDAILLDIPAGERDSVIVDFQPSSGQMEPGSLTGNFDITIRSVRSR